jgi:hypothetical protein
MIERITEKIGDIADSLAKVDFNTFSGSFEKMFEGVENFIYTLIGAVKIAWIFRGVIFAVLGVLGMFYSAPMLIVDVSKLFALWEEINNPGASSWVLRISL